MLSDVMEDYLKAIYELQQDEEPPVGTSDLASYLDVSAPTVTSMMGKLEERGLVTREKYKGVELTSEGETVAVEILRHHRLLESFLVEHLDYEWTDVHNEADTLEHHISEEFEQRIANTLDDPETDPHGDPIPEASLEPPREGDARPLSEFGVGDTLVVARVRDRDPAELSYLADAGIYPGRRLVVEERAPIGMYTVSHEGGEQHLPAAVADTIRARPADTTGSTTPENLSEP